MKRITSTFCVLLMLTLPLFTMAHPGHGDTDGYTIIHYFTEPMHAIITLGSFVLVFAVLRFLKNKQSQK